MPRKKLPPVETPYVNGWPLAILSSDHITLSAVRVYGALMYRMDKRSRRCWASMTTIGAAVGIFSRSTVWEALQVLETLRLIKRVQTRPGQPTIYEIRRMKRKHVDLILGLRAPIGAVIRESKDPRSAVVPATRIMTPPKTTRSQGDRMRQRAKRDADIRRSGEYKERRYLDLEQPPE